jgi:predicted enzyme related to lactoylglutathione lyase
MGCMLKTTAFFLAMIGSASAEPFHEVTISVPVTNMAEAEAWYAKFLGSKTEVLHPVPGVTEFKVSPGVWLQLFEAKDQATTKPILRFMVDNIATSQKVYTNSQINSGTAIEVPGIVTYSEFTDPFGNALGLYDLP